MSWYRLGSMPQAMKLTTFFTTVAIMISLSSAVHQPSTANLIWTTILMSLIVNVFLIIIVGLGFEDRLLFRRYPQLTWSLVEIGYNVVFCILYFVSIFIAISAANFGSTIAFSVVAFFSILNFIQYGFCVFNAIRTWMKDIRFAEHVNIPSFKNASTYGSD